MVRRGVGLAVAVACLFAVTTPVAQAGTTTPHTVPALQQWTPAGGSFTYTSSARIVVDPSNTNELTTDATTFADDLKQLTGTAPAIAQTARAGDIVLALGATGDGYSMSVGSTVVISAHTADGVFLGTRSILQLIKQSAVIPAGTAKDRPAKSERGLMVDVGRKFLTVGWVEQEIRELAYLKLNYLHLHLSDTYRFRLESSTHPEVVSADHYSKADIREILAVAARYHVTVVPELDMPGHMNAVLAAHPELKLKDSSGKASDEFVDLSNDASYALMKDLITEYLPLFPAPYWHIGADEYVTNYSAYPQLLTYARARYGSKATAKDAYYGFVNWANDLVRAAGKTTRMWNDGIKSGDGTISPAGNILVEYWQNYGLSPQQLLDAGHTLLNASYKPTYYVLGRGKPDTKYMYETWTPDTFQGENVIADGSRNLGSKIHVWCDFPNAESEDHIAAGITQPLRVLAQQTWGSPKPVTGYADFATLADKLGHAPGWNLTDRALNHPATASSTETPNFPAADAVDGNPATRWSSQRTDPQWIQVDLGTSVAVNRVVLAWEAAYASAYEVQVSDDAKTWRTIHRTTTGRGATNELTGLSGSGRHLRVYATKRGTVYGDSLYQLSVYGV